MLLAMESLDRIIVSDPAQTAAEDLSIKMLGISRSPLIVTNGQSLLSLCDDVAPDLILLSLDLVDPDPVDILGQLKKKCPQTVIFGTYRELSLSSMTKWAELGVAEIFSSPINTTQLYRLASKHFGRNFRRHQRYATNIPVHRADGPLLGHATNLSQGGMLLESNLPLKSGHSIWVELRLPQPHGPIGVRYDLVNVEALTNNTSLVRGEFIRLPRTHERELSEYLRTLSA